MRLIDVEQVYCSDCDLKGKCEALIEQKMLVCDVKSMPTIDAVPVVRCKDCKHQEACTRLVTEVIYDPVLKENVCYHYQMEYCSYGERRTTDEEV